MSALDAARRDLAERRTVADSVGNWQEVTILGPLADVADHVCRIGDHTDSAHYRADKAGALLAAAIRLQRATLLAYARWPEDSSDDQSIDGAFDLLEDLKAGVSGVAWVAARRASSVVCASDARRLLDTARRLTRWAESVAATAHPDPVE